MFLLWLRQLPRCGDWTSASVPPPTEGRSSSTNTPVSPTSSFILPSFVWFYIFFSASQVPLPVSAGVLPALLCLKLYSWCICGERCTPHPPTLPSCSPYYFDKICALRGYTQGHISITSKQKKPYLFLNRIQKWSISGSCSRYIN